MQTITLQRQDTAENITALAYILWYKDEIQDGEKEQDVMDWEEKIGTELVPNMIENTETHLQFVSRHYQNVIDSDILRRVTEAKKAELAAQRAKEDAEIEEGVKAQVGESKIITE